MAAKRGVKVQDVPGCEYHTFHDERTGKVERTGPCNGYCRIMADLQGGLPLTNFLCKLMDYSNADLAKADAKKAAKLYGIKLEHAQGYIDVERQLRNVKPERKAA